MIRPLLAIMAGLLCGLMGMRQSQRIREESHTLRRWEGILQQLCLILREGALPLHEALEQAAPEDSPADAQLRRLASAMRSDPLAPLSGLYLPQGKEGPALARMFTALAGGSLESRVQAVRYAAEEIALLSGEARDKARQDAAMWAKLGWTCGACLTLMLL
ncbi:MAG: hypothetical protein E7316_08495 [Clostridiales bacterium]|nr:hypothetical protein [Clostridiales bacterium]